MIDVARVVAVEHVEPAEEGLPLRVGVLILVFLCAVAQVVGDIVVGIEAVGSDDTSVDEPRHGLVIFVARQGLKGAQFHFREGFADFKVHASLGLYDTRENAVQVLAGLLGVGRIL